MSDNKKLLVVIDPGHTGNTYNAGDGLMLS